MLDKLILFDTTLRDGQLSPEVHFGPTQRLEIALSLENAGMDVIEVAFSGMPPVEFTSNRAIVKQVRHSMLCCLARMNTSDIDLAADLLWGCVGPRLHLYLDAKIIRSLGESGASRKTSLRRVRDMVSYARNLVPEVEFSPQDATRVSFESLVAVTRAALAGGAGIVNLSDTAGTATPGEIQHLFQRLFTAIPELNETVVSFHGHDHLGCSVDNALSAIGAGARQIEGTINGIGPAGGNTDLVELAGRLYSRAQSLNVVARADHERLLSISLSM